MSSNHLLCPVKNGGGGGGLAVPAAFPSKGGASREQPCSWVEEPPARGFGGQCGAGGDGATVASLSQKLPHGLSSAGCSQEIAEKKDARPKARGSGHLVTRGELACVVL